MKQQKIYEAIATAIQARNTCRKSPKNEEWEDRWDERIEQLMETAPSGSGFDSGTQLDETCAPERLVFHFGYHHMDGESGMYTHWTHHSVAVWGSLLFGFRTRITKGTMLMEEMACIWKTAVIKEDCPVDDADLDYFYDVFTEWLDSEAPTPLWTQFTEEQKS